MDDETVGFPIGRVQFSNQDMVELMRAMNAREKDRCPDDHDMPKPMNRSARRDRKLRPRRKAVPFWSGTQR